MRGVGRGSLERAPAIQICTRCMAPGVFWLAGCFASDSSRLALRVIAVEIDYSAPLFADGRRRSSEWQRTLHRERERFLTVELRR